MGWTAKWEEGLDFNYTPVSALLHERYLVQLSNIDHCNHGLGVPGQSRQAGGVVS